MKKMLAAALLLLYSILAQAQNTKVISVDEANALGMSLEQLDSQYPVAVGGEGTVSLFAGQEAEFGTAYDDFIRQFNAYLGKNGFVWERPTHCFSRIYFAPDGKVDYCILQFKESDMPVERWPAFKVLAETFVQNNSISITGSSKFSQCSPVKFITR